jgi:hypothetical protein
MLRTQRSNMADVQDKLKFKFKDDSAMAMSLNACDIVFPTTVQPLIWCQDFPEELLFALYVGTEDHRLYKLCFKTNAQLIEGYLGSLCVNVSINVQACQYSLLLQLANSAEERLAIADTRNSIHIVTIPQVERLDPASPIVCQRYELTPVGGCGQTYLQLRRDIWRDRGSTHQRRGRKKRKYTVAHGHGFLHADIAVGALQQPRAGAMEPSAADTVHEDGASRQQRSSGARTSADRIQNHKAK